MLFVTNVAPKIEKTKQNLFLPSLLVQFQWGVAKNLGLN